MFLRKAKTFLFRELGGLSRDALRYAWADIRLTLEKPEPVSMMVLCGNRLQQLRQTLPVLLNQAWPYYEVVLSLYADKEHCAEYCLQTFQDHIRSGRLRIISAEAEKFSGALCANNGIKAARHNLVQIWTTDFALLEYTGLQDLYISHRMYPEYDLISTPYVGTQVLNREKFIDLGGYDTTDTGVQQPVDTDHIARHLAHFKGERFLLHMPSRDWMVWVDRDGQVKERSHTMTARQMRARLHRCPVFQLGLERQALKESEERLKRSIFFTRVGFDYERDRKNGVLNSREFLFRTIRYYQTHNPRIPFRTTDYQVVA